MSETSENGQLSTEQLILAAAEKEFLQKGYAGARTTAIAEAAGVTHAMLHYYFRTKDKLFEKIICEKIALLRDIMIRSAAEPEKPLFERIADVISLHLDFLDANPDLPRFLIGEVFSQPERMAVITRQLSDHAPALVVLIQKQIDEYTELGLCRRVDARMLMLDIVSLNVFSFVAHPMIMPVLEGLMDDHTAFIEARKKENIDTIMRKLKL